MITSGTPENSANSTPDSAAALTAAQHPAYAGGAPVVAVIGDDQLVRMMQTEAIGLGQPVHLLTGSPDASAAQVCASVVIGDCHVWEGVKRAIAGAQTVTFDREHAPTEFLSKLTEVGYSVRPQPSALLYVQDKLLMCQRLEELGAPVPAYTAIESVRDAETFFDRVDDAVCLKARRGGHDGHGVQFPKDRENLRTLVDKLLGKDAPLMTERKIALIRGLSAICARTPSGGVKAWPVLESVQRDGICVKVVCPAPGLSDELASTAEKLSVATASELGVTSALAVELFETIDADDNPEIFVNELAVHSHSTSHWSQDGYETGQFEQHLRAVADLPLRSTRPTVPVAVMVNTLGGEETSDVLITQRFAEVWRHFPSVEIHWYRKDQRPGRKSGHVNLCGYDTSPEGIAETRRIVNLVAGCTVDGTWTGGDPTNDV